MPASLYDASVGTFLRMLDAVGNVLERGQKHCEANDIDLADVVETRLIEDMLPFRFQVVSVAHHSLGAIQGVEAGVFRPPTVANEDYGQLRTLVADARAGLAEYSPETVNGFAGGDLMFELGRNRMPFVAEDFLLSFSLPNFYFHATTAYDMLRMKGTPIGKRHFLGAMRMKT